MSSGEQGGPPGGEPGPGLDALFGLAPEQGDSWVELARAATQPAPPLGRLGEYELLEELGRGGQGTVYRARQPLTGRTVALKCLPARVFASQSSRERFRREVDALARLAHPGIVAIHGAEVIENHPVLVMEWVDGRPIDTWARGRGAREIVEVLCAICDGLSHAHRRGVLHRDLKPSNLLVDRAGRPRLLDFGLSKLRVDEEGAQVDVSRTAAFLGTPSFAPPEQVEGRWDDVDTRSDVYSLGAVMHLLLGGAPAFEAGAGLPELFDRIRAGLPDRPTPVLARAGRELDWIVRTALAPEPDRRYAGVEELGADLRRWLRGDWVAAHPPSWAYRLRKSFARHRVLYVTSALLLAGILGVAITVSVLALRLDRQGEQLEQSLAGERKALRAQRAGSAFLGSLLAGTGSLRRAGPDLSLAQLLDQGVLELDHGRLADTPAVEAEMRMQLGRAYRGLERFEAALVQHRSAVELASRSEGADSVLTARALDYLMRTLELAGRLAEAEAAGRRSLEILEQRLGPDAVDATAVRNDLASVLDEQGRFAEALQLYRRGLESAERQGNYSATALSGIHRSLGLELLELGRLDEALFHTRRALELMPPGDAATERMARTRRNLGRVLAARGECEQGIALLRESLSQWTSLYGPGHCLVAVETVRLGEQLAAQGGHSEALELLRGAVATLERALGNAHPWTIRARCATGVALKAAGEAPAALEALRAAHQGALDAAAGNEALVAATARALAGVLEEAGSQDEALAVLVQAGARLAGRVEHSEELRRGTLGVLDGLREKLAPGALR
ncbi:MAG: serine/threonine protein kinase [Planctomycetes bacterium]|nr:serine/threonine protein kinase [Planctomycetota bacterium]